MGETAEIMSVDPVADVSGSLNNTYFIFYTTPNLAYYMWFNVSGGGSDPAPSAPSNVTYLGIEIAIATNDSAATIATAIETVMATQIRKSGETELIDTTVTSPGAGQLTFTNNYTTSVPDIADTGATGFTLGTDQQGVGTNPCANGIWSRTSANTWDRAADMDTDAKIAAGDFNFAEEGTENAATGWIIVSINPLAIAPPGAEPVDWSQFSGSGSFTAGDGLDLTGTVFSVDKATEVAGSRAAVYVASDGVGIDLDNTTIDHSSSVLQVKSGGIGPTQMNLNGNYTWNGTDAHTGTLDLSSATLTLPLASSTPSGYTFTIVEEGSEAFAEQAQAIAEMNDNAATGGITQYEAVYLTSAGTIDQAIATSVPSKEAFMGIAQASASAGNPVYIKKNCRTNALFIGSLTPTVGDQVFVALTAGRLTNDISGWLVNQAIVRVGHITDTLSYDGALDFTMEIELKQHAPIYIV
jgi:hypothetical protein